MWFGALGPAGGRARLHPPPRRCQRRGARRRAAHPRRDAQVRVPSATLGALPLPDGSMDFGYSARRPASRARHSRALRTAPPSSREARRSCSICTTRSNQRPAWFRALWRAATPSGGPCRAFPTACATPCAMRSRQPSTGPSPGWRGWASARDDAWWLAALDVPASLLLHDADRRARTASHPAGAAVHAGRDPRVDDRGGFTTSASATRSPSGALSG